MSPLILVIDSGTMSARVSVVSVHGGVHGIEYGELSYEQETTNPQRRHFTPEWHANLLGRLAAKCISRLPIGLRQQISAVAVTGQLSGCVAIDQTGRVLFAAPHFDASGVECFAELQRLQNDFGFPAAYGPLSNLGRLVFLRYQAPQIFRQTRVVCSIPGFVAGLLTNEGRFTETPSTAADFGCFNIREKYWDDDKLQALGLDSGQLGQVMSPLTPHGSLEPNIARVLGLSPGLPVVLTGHHVDCAAIGVGAVSHGDTYAFLGTCGRGLRLQNAQDPAPEKLQCIPAPFPDMNYLIAELGEVEFLTSWFVRGLCFGVSMKQLLREAEASAPGCAGVRSFLGPRIPDHSDAIDYSGGWVIPRGLPYGRRQTRGDMFRSVLENIAFTLRQGLAAVESEIFPERSQLVRVSGELTQSPFFNQLLANTLDRSVSVLETQHIEALGAAKIATVACGYFDSLSDASLQLSAIPQVFEPDRETAKLYRTLFDQYCHQQRQQKALARVNKTTSF